MYFRLDSIISKLWLQNGPLEFAYDGNHKITISLRPPTQEEQQRCPKKEDALCSAILNQEPPPPIVTLFNCLAERRLPDGHRIPEAELATAFDENGHLKDSHLTDFRYLPLALESFAKDVNTIQWDYTRRTVKVLNWRVEDEIFTPHDPFGTRGRYWSIDGSVWRPIFLGVSMRLSAYAPPHVTNQQHNEIMEIVKSGETEPIGQELFREAWLQRSANPRSALILGVAAVEVGIKNLAARLTPDARWLLENDPTPPVVKMLKEYLPELPTRCKLNGKTIAPPKDILNKIDEGIRLRNRLVHVGIATLSYEELESVLLAVRDVLWMLDYYAGFSWTLEKIRPHVREKMI